MVKRAYGPREMMRFKSVPLPWDGEWQRVFGNPEINDMWFISGPSASGKSSFCMQLAKKLCEYGSVLYASVEEGTKMSFCQRLRRYHMEEVQSKFRVVDNGNLDDLKERLHKRKSAKFIILDSFQLLQSTFGWTFLDALGLMAEFPHKCFIFISQEYKSEPAGKGAVKLKYQASVKVRVNGYKAVCQGRFIKEAGAEFEVWQDGVIQTSNNL